MNLINVGLENEEASENCKIEVKRILQERNGVYPDTNTYLECFLNIGKMSNELNLTNVTKIVLNYIQCQKSI